MSIYMPSCVDITVEAKLIFDTNPLTISLLPRKSLLACSIASIILRY